MDDSENSRFAEGDDADGKSEPSILDDPAELGWEPAPGAFARADDVLGGLAPSADLRHDDPSWQQESQDDLQVPAAAAFVISQFVGDPFDLHYEARLNTGAEGFDLTGGRPAADAGAGAGMSLEGGAALLEQYGIDAHVEHGDISSLDRYLREGRSVILAVDKDELYGSDDDSAAAERTADHALVLVGIDEKAGVAILQDPANPAGQGYEVSLAALEDAWADSANGMVVTDAAVSTSAEARRAASAEGTDATLAARDDPQAERIRTWGPAGAVVLPILFGGRALIRRRTRA